MAKRQSQYKPVIGTYTIDQIAWITKNAKDAKLNSTAFLRAVLDHVRATTNGDLKKTLLKGKLEAELHDIKTKEQSLETRKLELEKELENIA